MSHLVWVYMGVKILSLAVKSFFDREKASDQPLFRVLVFAVLFCFWGFDAPRFNTYRPTCNACCT